MLSGTSVVFGPGGTFVIRAHRYGVPGPLYTSWTIVDLLQRVRRLLNSEKRWVIEVRRYGDDPWGPVVFSEVVDDKSASLAAMTSAEQAVRRGDLGC